MPETLGKRLADDAEQAEQLSAPYISPTSPLYLPYISPISPWPVGDVDRRGAPLAPVVVVVDARVREVHLQI